MNKRQKKKFEKKLFCKTYYGCRQRKLSLLAERYDVGENDILYIVDSKRMDLKHLHRVCVLKDVNIQPCYNTDHNVNDVDIEFSCNGSSYNDDINNIADELMNNYKNWFDTIARGIKSE